MPSLLPGTGVLRLKRRYFFFLFFFLSFFLLFFAMPHRLSPSSLTTRTVEAQ